METRKTITHPSALPPILLILLLLTILPSSALYHLPSGLGKLGSGKRRISLICMKEERKERGERRRAKVWIFDHMFVQKGRKTSIFPLPLLTRRSLNLRKQGSSRWVCQDRRIKDVLQVLTVLSLRLMEDGLAWVNLWSTPELLFPETNSGKSLKKAWFSPVPKLYFVCFYFYFVVVIYFYLNAQGWFLAYTKKSFLEGFGSYPGLLASCKARKYSSSESHPKPPTAFPYRG